MPIVYTLTAGEQTELQAAYQALLAYWGITNPLASGALQILMSALRTQESTTTPLDVFKEQLGTSFPLLKQVIEESVALSDLVGIDSVPVATPTPTATSTPTPKPTQTPKPTSTPKASTKPKPTSTPKKTPKPTSTPKPTATSTPTPKPTAAAQNLTLPSPFPKEGWGLLELANFLGLATRTVSDYRSNGKLEGLAWTFEYKNNQYRYFPKDRKKALAIAKQRSEARV